MLWQITLQLYYRCRHYELKLLQTLGGVSRQVCNDRFHWFRRYSL